MAVKIRLKRVGRRNRPFYRVVVMDARKRRDGAAIEELGWYNPIARNKEHNFVLKDDRILYWLREGAQTTETVLNLMRRAGIAHKWHLIRQGLDEKTVEKEMQKLALSREEAQKRKVKESLKKGKAEQAIEKESEALVEEKEVADETPLEAESVVDAVQNDDQSPTSEPDPKKSVEEEKTSGEAINKTSIEEKPGDAEIPVGKSTKKAPASKEKSDKEDSTQGEETSSGEADIDISENQSTSESDDVSDKIDD